MTTDAQFRALCSQIKTAGVMSPDALLSLRRLTAAVLTVSPEEADALFDLNDHVTTPEGWAEYFIDAVTTSLIYENYARRLCQ